MGKRKAQSIDAFATIVEDAPVEATHAEQQQKIRERQRANSTRYNFLLRAAHRRAIEKAKGK
jgi:hypothetical protein